ncbi:MAG: putative O-glycosylation ligase, exosortase A system-associated [Sphingomonadales bacterium]
MLRSIMILMMIIGTVPMIFVKPHVGMLVWSWISYMNPHRLSYGFAYDMPMLDAIAAATLVGWLISREPKRFRLHPVSLTLILFWGWTLVTTILSKAPDRSWPELTVVSKIMFFTLMLLPLITTKWRLHSLIYVIILSLGFFGIKGGLFTVITGGNYIVNGPAGTFIGDNNHLALALLMLIPLLRYVSLHGDTPWIRHAALWSIFIVAISILGSQSRGAFVAALVTMPILVAKGRRRIAIFALLGVMALGGLAFMPQEWRDRMATITTYEQDASATGRLDMWRGAFRLAQDHPFVGGGFSSNYHPPFMAQYMEPGKELRAYHSIYFMTLGEHGFVGLLLFLMIMTASYFTCAHIVKLARGDPDLKWAEDLAKMLQISLIAYGVAGAFLSLAKFDLFYHLCAMTLILHRVVAARLDAKAPAPALAAPRPMPAAMPRPAE